MPCQCRVLLPLLCGIVCKRMACMHASMHACILICLLLPLTYASEVQVTLADGVSAVIGRVQPSSVGTDVVQFLGIPFAQPPTKHLRFRKPLPLNGTIHPNPYRAFEQSDSCVQTPDFAFEQFHGATMWNAATNLSEDCLYLNMWVPGKEAKWSENPYPVMIWIYGGGYWSGAISLEAYDGRALSARQKVVLVAINYRVSIFGFLYGGDDCGAPGNAGLWDQQLAMKWVYENIANFGGDQNSITIFGESAGGASVSFHILAPSSWDYFHRSVMQSGSATAPWALETKSTLKERLVMVAKLVKCGDQTQAENLDYKSLVECLRYKPWQEVRAAEWMTSEFCDFPWTPMVDNDFLPDEPIRLLERGEMHKGEMLLGSNADESIYFIVYHLAQLFRKDIFFKEKEYILDDKSYRDAAIGLLPRKFVRNTVALDAIVHEYRPYNFPVSPLDRQRAIDRMLGDYHFTCNVNEFADYARRHGRNVYMYLFNHRASQQTWPEWMGVLHGYEIMFIFGEPLNDTKGYNEEEKELSRAMMDYWANFARTGDPNEGHNFMSAYRWPEYDLQRKLYISLQPHLSTGNSLRGRYCAFWKKYLPKLEAATRDITEAEMKWHVAFDKWENEYMRDWQHQMNRYARQLDLMAQEQSCRR